jgi:hypothetical protein
MELSLNLLGYKVRDSVTGFTGVVTSISFDLYGCIQGIVYPEIDKDGKIGDQMWFDVKRLIAISDKPVMVVPNFSKADIQKVPGGQKLPQFPSQPVK